MRLGKDKQAIILAVFLFFSASAGGQAGLNYKYQLDGELQDSVIIQGNKSIIFNYSISELNLESIINARGSFYRVSIPGHTVTSVTGYPELPVLSRLISIPDGYDYKVNISEVRSSKLKPSRKKIKGILYPVQDGETKETRQIKREFKIDKKVYDTKGIIASDTVSIERLGSVRNRKLANIYISPVRYNPASNVLEVITSMKIEVTFLYQNNSETKSLAQESSLFNSPLEKTLLNYDPATVIPGYSEHPIKMVIITDTAFKKQLLPFFKWKTQKGFDLKIIYKGVGKTGTTYRHLKDTLARIYNSATETDPPPEYLLIIGDIKRIPTSDVTNNISDMYYGEFDGNGDYIPEMFIGRLPAADTTEVKSVINKIIQYEKFEFADSNKFYTRSLFTAGNDATYGFTMNGQIKYATKYYFNILNKTNEYTFYYPESANLSVEDSIKKLLKKGVSFINYTGHGDELGWLDPTIRTKDIDSLKNKSMYPFVISNACRTSQFNLATSFGNRIVLSKDKGAIGFIGCSNDSYWDEDFFWAVGAGQISNDPTYQQTGLGVFDRMFHSHREPASDWYLTMGQINYAGNLSVSASTSAKKKYYWETYNLVGDPSLIPIIGTPDPFNIVIPDTLPNGIKSLTLNTDPFSYVAISHSDTLWDASYTNTSGSVELKMPGLSNDSCLIVVTGQNKIPIIKTVYISNISKEFINLSATSINDIQGNNNSRADFGETFYLNIKVSNLGLTDAENLFAKISSTSQLVTIVKDSAYIGTLAARTEKVLSDNLELTITSDIPDMGTIPVQLLLKDMNTEKIYTINITVHSPKLVIASCLISDDLLGNNNSFADPGETFYLNFKIINEGSSDISGQLHVESPDEDISILDSNVKSGILKFGETTVIPVMVKLSESVLSGSSISISSILDCSPFSLTNDFSFRVGRIRESFESTEFNVFPWINLSQIPWIISGTSSIDGTVSARSGAITHNGLSSLVIRTVYSTDDSVKFYYKVSSEIDYDNLRFVLNGTTVFEKSGEIPWTKIAVPVKAGVNKLEWIYRKDQSVSNGYDCAWIDMIDFADNSPVSYIQKDIQVARIVTPVQKDKYDKEAVTVKLLNIGTEIINGFNLAYRVNNNETPVKQYFTAPLIPFGDSVTVTFKTKANMSQYGMYEFMAYAYDNDDDYLLNDTLKKNIENKKLIDSLAIYPNPFTNEFTIFLNSRMIDNLHISITNVAGIRMYDIEKEILTGRNTIIISDTRLSPALYYLNIRGSSINKTIPIVKINK